MARHYNHRPDAEDRRDPLYISVTHSDATTLPKKVDLRSGCTDVVDQGELGSCTANAIASGLREYWERKIGPVGGSIGWSAASRGRYQVMLALISEMG